MVHGEWTVGELVGRAAKALAAGDVRAPKGRVTPLPDVRVVRWYATIGLVDRPLGMRGRTALYGPRHLYQLVAVKRRQAQGHTLADIQAELTGATDAVLRSIADMPASAADDPSGEEPASRRRFWAQAPTVNRDGVLSGVRLAGGVVLLLAATPDAA